MSERETSESKTELPTPKRLRDLRKQGQVPHSKDLPATASVLVGVLCLVFGGAWLLDGMRHVLDRAVTADFTTLADSAAILQWTKGLLIESVWLTLPLILLLTVVSIVAGFIEVGPVFSMEAIKPQLNRINPIEGTKRLFSLANLVELLKLLVKFAVLTAVVVFVVLYALPSLMRSHWLPEDGILPFAFHLFSMLAWSALACFIFITVFDVWFQRWDFTRRNRMTQHEVKREYKEMEGDPYLQQRRRELHREVNEANMLENVRKAVVVVVNPTHIAIALYYEAGETDLPIVVAKGEGDLARRIRRIAEEERIPILHNVDLARRMQAGAPLNQYIPDEFIEPVAAILRWVRDIKRTPAE